MSIKEKVFGIMPDGKTVMSYTLRNKAGMKVKISAFGGAIMQIKVPDRKGCFTDVVCGYDCLEDYINADGYQGALVGRFGNRIAKGLFTLDGVEYKLFCNNGANHLHGGKCGFSHRLWNTNFVDGDEPELILALDSPDGDEGYPGNLSVCVKYKLLSDNALSIEYFAETDKNTPISLTNHTYFNLGGYASGTIREHTLMLDADTYLPTSSDLIPTGEIRSVDGTPFDFRAAKKIGTDIDSNDIDLLNAGGYDHCFNFVGGQTDTPVLRGTLYCEKTGRMMEVYTDRPCVQFYSGNFMKNENFPFKGGFAQAKQNALCLETQGMPDSINHPNFIDCVLKPGEKFHTQTIYKFSVK